MKRDFLLPTGLIGRFAIVKLWPGIKTAEDECIARIKIAAVSLGLECIEVHADGRFLLDPSQLVSSKNVDFVIHLHYDTPKLYDAFSFVALWNPIQFYHEWGYARTSRNLLTHDDFLSCSSNAADDHVRRLVRTAETHLAPKFTMYHSIAEVVSPPSLGDGKLFYAGINWDALRGGVSRHQDLLKRLDGTGSIRIYGPTVFQGVKVWAGYKSYVRELPFDGVSMLGEISRAGIALVLSSQAHKDSELMSNRLFESVASGALVICDENNFAKKFFGDTLLYIDSRLPVEEIFEAIETHIAWAKANTGLALAMIARSQQIFSERFALTRSLSVLYSGLNERKQALVARHFGVVDDTVRVTLFLLLPEFSRALLSRHIFSVVCQTSRHFKAVFVTETSESEEVKAEIRRMLEQSNIQFEICEVTFYSNYTNPRLRARLPTGKPLSELLPTKIASEFFVLLAPNETLFSNHLTVLLGALSTHLEAEAAAVATILKHTDQPVHSVQDRVDFRQFDLGAPIGYGRFMFRASALPDDLHCALPYLDRKSIALLLGGTKLVQELPATITIDVTNGFPSGPWDEGQENNLIASYCPEAFEFRAGREIRMPDLEQVPGQATQISHGMKRFSRKWFQIQLRLLRSDGPIKRLKVFKRKAGGFLAG